MSAVEKADYSSVRIDLRHAILMIARSLDYVGVDDTNHGHRVGYIAYSCAKQLGWATTRQEFIYLAGLLHDCGVSSSREHDRLLSSLRQTGLMPHCLHGNDYLESSVVLRPFAPAVKYHHTPWNVLREIEMDEADRQAAALIHLADRVDFMRGDITSGMHADLVVMFEDQIAAQIMQHAGTLFHPEYAEAMATLSGIDGFWYTMDQGFIEDIGLKMGAGGEYDMPLSVAETINLARVMAKIVDAKSPFTKEHSERVAMVAKELARDMELDPKTQQEIEIAGLLHDVGKLRVQDELLDKQGKLSDAEFARIRRHVVDTGLALDGCFPDSKIPAWAANHHEKLDGSGYPFRLTAEELDLPSRIIAVADIFQALAQNRPYRGSMRYEEIEGIMAPMVGAGKLDRDVFECVRARASDYYEIATGIPRTDRHVA